MQLQLSCVTQPLALHSEAALLHCWHLLGHLDAGVGLLRVLGAVAILSGCWCPAAFEFAVTAPTVPVAGQDGPADTLAGAARNAALDHAAAVLAAEPPALRGGEAAVH